MTPVGVAPSGGFPLYGVPQRDDSEDGLAILTVARLVKQAAGFLPESGRVGQRLSVEGDIVKSCHSAQLLYCLRSFPYLCI